jgi:small subunit ribosomal protein S6
MVHYRGFGPLTALARGRAALVPCSPPRAAGRPPQAASGEDTMKTIDYEVTYIVRPNLEETELDERVNAIAEQLKSNGAELGEIEKMGKRRLAYEIDDVREGYYVVMKFKSEPAQAKELERQMRLSEDVMRHLLINLNE